MEELSLDTIRKIGDNDRNLEELEAQLRGPFRVVPFVGAGLSIPFGFPGWTEFLNREASKAGIGDQIANRIDKGQFEEAAEDLERAVGDSAFQDLIVYSFGNHKLEGVAVDGAVTYLHNLTVGPVITTNFDGLLERAFEDRGSPFMQPIIWGPKPDLMHRALVQGQRRLIIIHGDWQDRTDRVLTSSEYRKYYGTRKNEIDLHLALPRRLMEAMMGKVLLFVGCSLAQDRTVRLLSRLSCARDSATHFALLEYPGTDEEVRVKARALQEDLGIRPIWFPRGRFELIQGILAYLSNIPPAANPGVSAFPTHAVVSAQRIELSTPGPPSNLPASAKSFIGRESDLAEVASRVQSQRMITLTGSGGCGKTQLAIQVGRTLLPQFPDGVWQIGLQSLSAQESGLVPQRAAAALGLQEERGRAILTTLIEHLKPRSTLLILDNCEHLIEECARFASQLISECPGMKILATSRQRLDCDGETLWHVPSLSLPAAEDDRSVAQVAKSEAVQLFVARAQALEADFEVNEENARSIADLCRRLDGIPLGIELAAAWIIKLSVKDIDSRLDRQFDLLITGSRTAVNRQQTLRNTMDWSYNLLAESERTVLRRLSVFAGGWQLDAARDICSDGNRLDAEPLLFALVDKSLAEAEIHNEERRYRLLESVKQYGAEKLEQSGEAEVIRARHANWFLALIEGSEKGLLGGAQSAWLNRWKVEIDNVRSAWRYAVEHKQFQQTLGAAGVIWRFCEMRGFLTEGRSKLNELLTLTDGLPASADRSKALNGTARLAYRQGDLEEATRLYTQSLEMSRSLGDQPGIADALNDLGNVARERGEFHQAGKLYAESAELQHKLGRKRPEACALNNLGYIAIRLGNNTEAETQLLKSRALFEEIEDFWDAAFSITGLGHIELSKCDETGFKQASLLYNQALAIRRGLGDKRGQADSLIDLGKVAHEQQDFTTARSKFEEALSMHRDLGNQKGVSESILYLGLLAIDEKDLPLAHKHLAEATEICKRMDNKWGMAECLEGFGWLAQAAGSPARAARLLAAAEAVRESLKVPLNPTWRPEHERDLAGAEFALGEARLNEEWRTGGSMSLADAIDYALQGNQTARPFVLSQV